MKNIKLNARQIKLLINFTGLFLFAITYLYIYSAFVEKTEAAKKEADNIRSQIASTEQILAEEEALLTELDEIKQQKQEIIDAYPVYIAKEDNLMFLDKLNKAVGIKMTSHSITDSSIFYTTVLPAVANTDGNESDSSAIQNGLENNNTVSNTATSAANNNISNTTANSTGGTETGGNNAVQVMTGVHYNISLNFQTTTEGFKELVDYINNYPDRTMIQNASISYDNSTGGLTGNINIKRFALTGSGKEYKAADIGHIDIGTENIFGVDKGSDMITEIDQPNDEIIE